MRKLFIFVTMLLIVSVFGMTAFAADITMTVSGNTVTAHNAPEDSTLFTVSYKDGKISSVSMVKGEGTINADVSAQKTNSDTLKAFLWDLKTLTPLTESRSISRSKTLVACFSATGHTKPLAEYAAKYLGADFYEIVPEEPYTDDDLNYSDSNSRTTKEQNDSLVRPKISGGVQNMDGYDTVIIAHPIWWGQAPKIIYTFLESYDFSGKTLTTMCTSGSSPLGSSANNLKALTDDSVTWLESRRFSIGASESEVQEWLDGIGLEANNDDTEPKEKEMIIKINGQTIPVTWEDNESVTELKKQAEKSPITVQMSKYGGFEQVGSLGRTYPSNDTRITTQNGDIVLYSSNQIVMFYGSNIWEYTRLGKVNLPENEVTGLLENENVILTITIE
ncbi:MAG: hypothetical protein IJH37_10715 [Clostridia bacterium]|nr:hypothetical protein [Clostridia bacterium]